MLGEGALGEFALGEFDLGIAPSGAGGGGSGSGWDVGLYEKKRRLEQLRALKFATENEERTEIGRYLRELAAGELPATVAMTPAGVREMHVDSRIAMMLAKSDYAPMEELRGLIEANWLGRADRGAEERLALRDRSPLVPLTTLRRDPHLEMHTRGG